MERRKFLKNSIAACASTLLLESISKKAFGQSGLFNALRGAKNDKVLVFVQLNGGNDGLNTILPLDQYTNLSAARSNILIPDTKALALNGLSATGFHPSMSGLKELFDSKYLSFVQGVSYPTPDFSHFRATDIWLSGANYNQYLTNGVAGRYLEQEFPGFPVGYPSTEMPDPLAIQIGSNISLMFQGTSSSMGMSLSSLSTFYNIVSGNVDPVPNTPAGHELKFLRQVSQQTAAFNNSIKNAGIVAPTNLSTKYPGTPDNALGDQLKIVARLIKGGLKTKVYLVSLGGFDTHASQTGTDTTTGTHATLLSRVSSAIAGFQDDCIKMGIQDRVTGIVFSEFGRRIKSNASGGTDHGSSAPVILFGTELLGGMYGSNPIINNSITPSSNVPMQFDFRSIYYSIMKDWFELSDTALNTVMLNTYPYMKFFKSKSTGITDNTGLNATNKLGDVFPNPVETYATIPVYSDGELLSLKLMDQNGRELRIIMERKLEPGLHHIPFYKDDLPSGNYILQLSGSGQQAASHVLIK